MKIKVFTNSMRFIDDEGQWWRIHFANKQVQHRCFVEATYEFEGYEGDWQWVPSKRELLYVGDDDQRWFIRCSNCVELAPDDVTAHARIMGLELPIRERPSIEEQLEELQKLTNPMGVGVSPPPPNVQPWGQIPRTGPTWIWQGSGTSVPNIGNDQIINTGGTGNMKFTYKDGIIRYNGVDDEDSE